MAHKPEIGSISHGTLRNLDLIEAFADELALCRGNEDHQIIQEARAVSLLASLNYDVADMESASELVNDLQDALNEYAPDGCYFGTHEGDGSDFGFWPSND
jgi:hypothetical protein